jgi:hypothetical protein
MMGEWVRWVSGEKRGGEMSRPVKKRVHVRVEEYVRESGRGSG